MVANPPDVKADPGASLGQRTTRVLEVALKRGASIRTERTAADNERLRDRFCAKPFDHFELSEDGSVHLCCPAWLRQSVGNLNTQEGAAIWNGDLAQEQRRSILDGSFRYCNHLLCPEIQAGTLPTRAEAVRDSRLRAIIEGNTTAVDGVPRKFNFAHDRSCNMSCPSCRTSRIQHNDGPEYEARRSLQDRLAGAFLRNPTEQTFTLSITGSGDPFASRIFREFLFSFDGRAFPGMNVNLQTNGVLFTERTWRNLSKLHGRIGTVLVSFDAATAGTYAITRRGGDWPQLLENMDLLARLRREREIRKLTLYFVVRVANFREMPATVELGHKYGADEVNFSKVVWWGTWSREEMHQKRVWEPSHPDYAEFERMIVDPIFDDPIAFLGNVSDARRRALARLTPDSGSAAAVSL